jgi:hypothetical protein
MINNSEVDMKIIGFLASLILVMTATTIAQDQKQTPQIKSTAEIMTQPMNVFRRFSGDAKPIYDFYGKAIGLKQLTTYNLGGGTNVARFEIGPTQLKFTAVVANRKYQQGPIQDSTGLRILTFFFPNQDPIMERFKANGLKVPDFRPLPGSKRSSALIQDPAGQWVELVIAPRIWKRAGSSIASLSDLKNSRR